MKTSWEFSADRLRCQWSEFGHYLRYEAQWLTENPKADKTGLQVPPDFAKLSPFGGSEWYACRPSPTYF